MQYIYILYSWGALNLYLDFILNFALRNNYILLDDFGFLAITYPADIHVEICSFSTVPAFITTIFAKYVTLVVAFQFDMRIWFIIFISEEQFKPNTVINTRQQYQIPFFRIHVDWYVKSVAHREVLPILIINI